MSAKLYRGVVKVKCNRKGCPGLPIAINDGGARLGAYWGDIHYLCEHGHRSVVRTRSDAERNVETIRVGAA